MKQTGNDARLSLLPVVGTDIRVHSQKGTRTYLSGRISFDGEAVIIDVIRKSRSPKEFPTISKTVTLELGEIIRLSFRIPDDERFERVSLLGDSGYWLKDVPRSGKSSVLVLCANRRRSIDIACGWVEYTRDRIIVREVTNAGEEGATPELETHERRISEVALVFVSDAEESKVCVRTTETK